MWLFAGFVAVPLIEIALFVTLGGWLGLWPTLAIVVGTGVAGVLLIRRQGVRTVDGLRQATQPPDNPVGQAADTLLIVLAGILLILPGFLTDTLGLALLVPPVRALLLRGLGARIQMTGQPGERRRGPEVIDGEFFEIGQDQSDDHPSGRPPSAWTRH